MCIEAIKTLREKPPYNRGDSARFYGYSVITVYQWQARERGITLRPQQKGIPPLPRDRHTHTSSKNGRIFAWKFYLFFGLDSQIVRPLNGPSIRFLKQLFVVVCLFIFFFVIRASGATLVAFWKWETTCFHRTNWSVYGAVHYPESQPVQLTDESSVDLLFRLPHEFLHTYRQLRQGDQISKIFWFVKQH